MRTSQGRSLQISSKKRIKFPVSLRNRLISGGLEPVVSHTEKLCLASYYIQFSTNVKMYNQKIKPPSAFLVLIL